MSANQLQAKMFEDLEKALQKELKLEPKTSLNELLVIRENAAYFKPSGLRMAEHFDPEPDLLIFDSFLGTLGLIKVLAPKWVSEETAELEIQKQENKRLQEQKKESRRKRKTAQENSELNGEVKKKIRDEAKAHIEDNVKRCLDQAT